MAKVEWVKIYTDMFDNKKIKYIRALPEGNNILLIWIMLITMAGRCNENGYIFLTENIPYTPDLLAKELGFEVNTVIFALNSLQNLNMISISENNLIYICGWCEYQNIEGMDKIRLQNATRQARYREKKKLIALEIESSEAPNNQEVLLIPESSNSNVTVTLRNGTEEDKEIRNKKENKNKKKEIEEIILYLNNRCKTFFKTSTKSTVSLISARLEEGFSLEQLKAIIDVKAKEWLNTPGFAKYLRPSTLFTSKHCEEYLNQAIREGVYKNGECNTKLGTVRTEPKTEDDVERALRKQGKSVADLKESTDYDF
nr:phage replisome organizer N-terminal domain-containing protein [uncultured Cellulosilyticum sp.]